MFPLGVVEGEKWVSSQIGVKLISTEFIQLNSRPAQSCSRGLWF